MFQHAMQAIVTVPVLAACLYALLFRQKDTRLRSWAMGAIGVLLGYWLRSM
jgi:hypothetical protein